MARYSRIRVFEQILWETNCPVIVSKHALLKDNAENQLILQLKLQNITRMPLSGTDLQIDCLDDSGAVLETRQYSFSNLSIDSGQYFGDRDPIPVPDGTVRASVVVENVYILDKSYNLNFRLRPHGDILEEASKIQNPPLFKTLVEEHGGQALFIPVSRDTYWQCSCGQFNANAYCVNCGIQKDDLMNDFRTAQETPYVPEIDPVAPPEDDVTQAGFADDVESRVSVSMPDNSDVQALLYGADADTIKCPECGADIPDSSETCPECGYPIRRPKNKTYEKIVKAIAGIKVRLCSMAAGHKKEKTKEERPKEEKSKKTLKKIAAPVLVIVVLLAIIGTVLVLDPFHERYYQKTKWGDTFNALDEKYRSQDGYKSISGDFIKFADDDYLPIEELSSTTSLLFNEDRLSLVMIEIKYSPAGQSSDEAMKTISDSLTKKYGKPESENSWVTSKSQIVLYKSNNGADFGIILGPNE